MKTELIMHGFEIQSIRINIVCPYCSRQITRKRDSWDTSWASAILCRCHAVAKVARMRGGVPDDIQWISRQIMQKREESFLRCREKRRNRFLKWLAKIHPERIPPLQYVTLDGNFATMRDSWGVSIIPLGHEEIAKSQYCRAWTRKCVDGKFLLTLKGYRESLPAWHRSAEFIEYKYSLTKTSGRSRHIREERERKEQEIDQSKINFMQTKEDFKTKAFWAVLNASSNCAEELLLKEK